MAQSKRQSDSKQKVNGSQVLVLVDQYVGNANQARALARLMGWDGYHEHLLEYSRYGALPNFVQFGFSNLTRKSAKSLRTLPLQPKIIISAGRRAAQVATALKRLHPQAQLLQIMKPECDWQQFGSVILPEHDRKEGTQYPANVIFIPGALVQFDSAKLHKAAQDLKAQLTHSGPYLSLFIGGATKAIPFDHSQFMELWQRSTATARALKAMLLISTSRRTPSVVITALQEQLAKLDVPYYSYIYGDPTPNPYLGMLGITDYFITTADSISMCSECCVTGKPTYIYLPQGIPATKHRRFVESLFNTGAAAPLTQHYYHFQSKVADSYSNLRQAVESSIIASLRGDS